MSEWFISDANRLFVNYITVYLVEEPKPGNINVAIEANYILPRFGYMKFRFKFGIYVLKGSINCQLAEKTGFTEEDAEKIKHALATLFENDCSAARPEGTMNIEKLFWFKHNCKSGQYSSAKVHNSVIAKALCEEPTSVKDYEFIYDGSLEGLTPEVIE